MKAKTRTFIIVLIVIIILFVIGLISQLISEFFNHIDSEYPDFKTDFKAYFGIIGIIIMVSIVLYEMIIGKNSSRSRAIREEQEKINMEKARRKSLKKEEEARIKEQEKMNRENFIQNIRSKSTTKTVNVKVLGGAGWEKHKEESRLLSLTDKSVLLSDVKSRTQVEFPFENLFGIEIGGPGKKTGNLGLMGGGFGVEGALKGMAAATIVNLLTTHSSTKTVLRITAKESEVVLFTSDLEPDGARMFLSPAFLVLSKKQNSTAGPPKSMSYELKELSSLRASGVLSEKEFVMAKQKILAGA